MNDIGAVLIKLRGIQGYSQNAVAEGIGINTKTYARYEAGKSEMKASVLKKVADYYGMTIDELFEFNPKANNGDKKPGYKEELNERGKMIGVLEEKVHYLTKEVDMLRELAETKTKYLELLEQKLKGKK